jgi:hypothetical protein
VQTTVLTWTDGKSKAGFFLNTGPKYREAKGSISVPETRVCVSVCPQFSIFRKQLQLRGS